MRSIQQDPKQGSLWSVTFHCDVKEGYFFAGVGQKIQKFPVDQQKNDRFIYSWFVRSPTFEIT
jgi:hypothetical protein